MAISKEWLLQQTEEVTRLDDGEATTQRLKTDLKQERRQIARAYDAVPVAQLRAVRGTNVAVAPLCLLLCKTQQNRFVWTTPQKIQKNNEQLEKMHEQH